MEAEVREKIKYFQDDLLDWFRENGRVYKWREPVLTPYEYIIAEVLLQRTKAETVATFYNNFIKDFPYWDSIAQTPKEVLEEYLKPIGLYRQRACSLLSLSKEMVKRNGILPDNRQELESNPLMGQYIANAVELMVFRHFAPLLDVNMARVVERFFGPRKLADIRHDPYLQELAQSVVNLKTARKMNWAILDFAALVCQARKPKCPICPIRKNCLFSQAHELS